MLSFWEGAKWGIRAVHRFRAQCRERRKGFTGPLAVEIVEAFGILPSQSIRLKRERERERYCTFDEVASLQLLCTVMWVASA